MESGRRSFALHLAASILLLGACLSGAHAQILGPEFQVNTYTTGTQYRPKVAAAGDGFVVVWESAYQDRGNTGLFGQRFGPDGQPVVGEFQVPSSTQWSQYRPAVAAAADGGFLIVWDSSQDGSDLGIFGRRFDAAGMPLGDEFQINSHTSGQQGFPRIAGDGAGNFVVVWMSLAQDGSYEGVFAQRFDAGGVPMGSEFQVNGYTTGGQYYPRVAADGRGDFVVVWNEFERDGSATGVFGRRFDATGSPLGPDFQVNTLTWGDQGVADVACDSPGDFVVAWSGPSEVYSSNNDALGQRFDADENRVGGEFRINTFTEYNQRPEGVAFDAVGNFVVVWGSYQDGSEGGVFAQEFDSASRRVGSELRVNSFTLGSQWGAAVASMGTGHFIVVWQSFGQDGSGWGVFGQRLEFPLFHDGFEAGDACAWSAVVGGGCP